MIDPTCDWLCDAWTVIGKELKDLTHAAAAHPVVRGLWLLMAGVFGVALPWLMGPAWLTHPQLILLWLLLPIPMVVAAVAESIAGEREHHTLEPLLATRLPVRAILAGKVAAAALFGWLAAALIMLIGLLVVNVVAPADAWLLYPPTLAGAGLGLGLLTAFSAACVGAAVALHTATVGRAYRAVAAVLLVIIAGLAGATALLLHLGAAYQLHLTRGWPTLPSPAMLGAIVLVLADVALFFFAGRRFQRSSLLAD